MRLWRLETEIDEGRYCSQLTQSVKTYSGGRLEFVKGFELINCQ